jgi:hypothetical protein
MYTHMDTWLQIQAIAEMEIVKLANGLTDSDLAIRGTSHIGGHKLAGVCIGMQ